MSRSRLLLHIPAGPGKIPMLDYRPRDGGIARLLRRQGFTPRWLVVSYGALIWAGGLLWIAVLLWMALSTKVGR